MNPANSIDEDTVRALLADVADAPEPPSRISIEGCPRRRPPPAVGGPRGRLGWRCRPWWWAGR